MLAVATRSPFNNIYTGFPSPLLDPVLERHVNEVMEIISRTFWANVGAWRFTQACREMVHRGLNVNQITYFIGPGGVGLSLFTAHLDAMYGQQIHRYFDPAILFTDDEMRKVIPLLLGGKIFSGGERRKGIRDRLREDLLKKFATAEGITGRLPYAILTKLIKLVGWKRIACNSLFRFDDIVEEDFESILRR